jgi:hypothetical protein
MHCDPLACSEGWAGRQGWCLSRTSLKQNSLSDAPDWMMLDFSDFVSVLYLLVSTALYRVLVSLLPSGRDRPLSSVWCYRSPSDAGPFLFDKIRKPANLIIRLKFFHKKVLYVVHHV